MMPVLDGHHGATVSILERTLDISELLTQADQRTLLRQGTWA